VGVDYLSYSMYRLSLGYP